MRIKAVPDADGFVRFELDNEAMAIATYGKPKPPSTPAPSVPPVRAPQSEPFPTWRRGYPGFQVPALLDRAHVSHILDSLHADTHAIAGGDMSQLVLCGLTEFEASSMVHLSKSLSAGWPQTSLVIDFDDDAVTE